MSDRAQILVSAIDQATDVLDKIERKMGSVGDATDKLKYALGALGGALSVGAFANMIEGAIGAENALYELNLKTGLSVELLSALRPIAAEAGSNMDLVGTSVQKLEKNMLSFVQTGMGPAALGFRAIGISQEEAQAGLQNMNAFLPEFAKKLLAAGNGAQVAALAQEIFGKAGANLIPVLTALAEQAELVGTKTAEQVARAHEFTVEMAQMSERTELLKESMADGLLPALIHIGEAFADLLGKGTDAEGFFSTLGTALKYGSTAAASFWLALKDMGDGIGALAAQSGALLSGNLAAFKAIGAERDAQAAKNQAEFDAFQKNMLGADHGPPAGNADVAGTGDFSVGGGRKKKTGDLSEHDLQEYKNAVQAVKELRAAEKARAKDQAAQAKAFDKATAEFLHWTDEQQKALVQQADGWLNLIDPTKQYYDQMNQIELLVEKGYLTREQGDQAEKVTMDSITQALYGTADGAKQADDFGKKMGQTFSSAFENAIVKGKSLRDVLKGIGQDIATIIARQTITNPLGSAVSSATSSAASSVGSWFSTLFGGGSPEAQALNAGIIPMAAGGDFTVSQPTLFLAGEAGPERASFSGANNTGSSSGGGVQPVVVQFNINANDSSGFARMLAHPTAQRTIRGIIEKGYAANGTVSGMAAT